MAHDGEEGVRKAKALRPDLVLLDIELPRLNGIMAAKLMKEIDPVPKVLFISQTTALDVVREALEAGASGFVAKSDASEMVEAITAIRQGRYYLSSSLAKHRSTLIPNDD